MKIPFLDYGKLYTEHSGEIDTAIKRCLVTGKLILQEDVEEFERRFAELLKVRHVIALASGTDALLMALKASGVGPGDEVISVSNTFIATIQVIHHLGAKPVLVDVNENGLMNMHEVEKEINNDTKAIIPVHLSGDVCDMDKLEYIRSNHPQIHIIEDAAQAVSATWRRRKAGTFGTAGCFSFYPAKILGTFGDAGALATNDKDIADRVRSLRNHGGVQKYDQPKYEYGWNSRMDNIWAAALNIKLKYLDRNIARRKQIAEVYDSELKGLPIKLPKVRNVYQDYIIRLPLPNSGLAEHLTSKGIETLGSNLLPNHLHKGLKLDIYHLPVTEDIVKNSIRISCNQFLTDKEQSYVIESIKEYF